MKELPILEIFPPRNKPNNIYSIEITNHCNLTCPYCPLTTSKRPKGYMDEITFSKIIDYLVEIGQKCVGLHGFGEPLLHPNLENFIRHAFSRGILPAFSTNAGPLTKEQFVSMADAGLGLMIISFHNKKSLRVYEEIRSIARKKGCVLITRS